MYTNAAATAPSPTVAPPSLLGRTAGAAGDTKPGYSSVANAPPGEGLAPPAAPSFLQPGATPSAAGQPPALALPLGRFQLASDLCAELPRRGGETSDPPPSPPPDLVVIAATTSPRAPAAEAPPVPLAFPTGCTSPTRTSVRSLASKSGDTATREPSKERGSRQSLQLPTPPSPVSQQKDSARLPTLLFQPSATAGSDRCSGTWKNDDFESLAELEASERKTCMDMVRQTSSMLKSLRFRMVAEEQAGNVEDSLCEHTVICACHIKMIRDINPVNATFNCRFTVVLEWVDPAARGMPLGKVPTDQRKKLAIPEIGLQNALAASLEVHAPPQVLCEKTGHVMKTILFQAVVQMDLDMRTFPFDTQRLPIIVGMRSRRDRARTLHCRFCYVGRGIRLDEWSILSNFQSADRPDGRARAQFGVVVVRAYWYYVMNVLLTLVFLTTLVFFGRLLDVDNLFDRLRIGFGILLAQTTFRMSIENKLPKVAYATAFDMYSMCCQLAVISLILSNVTVNRLRAAGYPESLTYHLDSVAYSTIVAVWLLIGMKWAWSMKKHVDELRQPGACEELGEGAQPKKAMGGRSGVTSPPAAGEPADPEPPKELAEICTPQALEEFCIMERSPNHVRPTSLITRCSLEPVSVPGDAADTQRVVMVAKVLLLFVDPLATMFDCKFSVYLEWVHEGAIGLPVGRRLDTKQLKDLGMPKVRADGAVSISVEDGPFGYVANSDTGLVVASTRFMAKFPMHLDLSRFPFDEQKLALSLQVSEEDPDAFPRPLDVRGFTLEPGSAHLEEWIMRGQNVTVEMVNGDPEARLEIMVSRRSSYYMRSVMAVLLGISSTVFTLFVVDLRNFSDQGKVYMPLLMTLLMFKFSIANTIPKVANSTIFDRYVMGCQGLFFAAAVICAFCLVLDETQLCSLEMAEMIRRTVAAALALIWASCNCWLLRESARQQQQQVAAPPASTISEDLAKPAQGSRPVSVIEEALQRPLSGAVRLQVDVKHIHSVTPAACSFSCDFQVSMFWIDAAAKGLAPGTKLSKDWPGSCRHPHLLVENAVQAAITQVGDAEVVDGQCGHVRVNLRVRAKLRMRLNLARFPFDEQALPVVLSLPEPQDRHRHLALDKFSGPGSVCIGEWSVLGSFASGATVENARCVVFGARILRFPRYFVQHILTILIFSTFTMLVYTQDVSDFAGRAKVLVGVMLVQIVSKISVGSKLPCMAVITVFDQCALNGLGLLFPVFFSCAFCACLLFAGVPLSLAAAIDFSLGAFWLLVWVFRMRSVMSRVLSELRASHKLAEDALPEAFKRDRSTARPRSFRASFRTSFSSIVSSRSSGRLSFTSRSSTVSQEVEDSLPAPVLMELAQMKGATSPASVQLQPGKAEVMGPDATASSSHEAPPRQALESLQPADKSTQEAVEMMRAKMLPLKGVIAMGAKIWGISDIDAMSSTFEVKFHLFLSWHDPAAIGKATGLITAKCLTSWGAELPRVSVTNALTLMSENMSELEVVDGVTGRLSCRIRYHGRMQHTFLLASFPFDSQALTVKFEVTSMADGTDRTFVNDFCDVHVQDEDMEGWHLVATVLAQDEEPGPSKASIRFVVQRSFWYYVRVKIILCLTSSLCLSFYLLEPISAFPARIVQTLKIVLTQTTFRFSVEPRLPKAPHWTPFDVYAVSCTIYFVLVCMGFTFVGLYGKHVPDERDLNYLTMGGLMGFWALWNLGYWSYLVVLSVHERRQTLAAVPPQIKTISDVPALASAMRGGSVQRSSVIARLSAATEPARDGDEGIPDLDPQLVSVAFRIWLVRNIDPIKGTFDCKFRVFLEWFEKEAVGVEKGKKVKHFKVPEICIDNAIAFKVLDRSSAAEVVNTSTGHVAAQILYQTTLKMDHEVQLFPFDCQWLAIAISLNNDQQVTSRSFLFQYCELDGRLQFEEWDVHGEPAFSTLKKHDAQSIMCGVLIRRCPRYYVVNIMGMLCLITALSLTVFAIKQRPGELSWQRWDVLLAIFPLIVLFKVSAAQKLPRVNYKTMFDVYTLGCQRIFILISVNSVVATLASSLLPQLPDSLFNEWACWAIALIWFLWNVKTAVFAWRTQKLRPEEALRFRAPVPLRLQDAEFLEGRAVMQRALDCGPTRSLDSCFSLSGLEEACEQTPSSSPSRWMGSWFAGGTNGCPSDPCSPSRRSNGSAMSSSNGLQEVSAEDLAIRHVRRRVTWQKELDK